MDSVLPREQHNHAEIGFTGVLGFRVWGLGFRVLGLGLGFRFFRVSGFRVWGLGFLLRDSG